VQSTQLIADSARPVEILTQLSQNFPKYATTLARRVVANESIQEELRSNGMHAQPGGDMVWLNGAVVQEKDMDPFVCVPPCLLWTYWD
jgi:UDP-glucose:glycoprotein glucosyltransferase